MSGAPDWQAVLDAWFPPGLEHADLDTHARMFQLWFGGGAEAGLQSLAPLARDARAGRLGHWAATPHGRLSLIILLDQVPRSLSAGTPEAYAGDAAALRIAEEGLWNEQYDALDWPWERTFFILPLAHAEGRDHLPRLHRVVAMAEAIAWDAPARLAPLYAHSASQARGHREVVARFGRYPHRNPILGRVSTAEEAAYLAQGDFVHLRGPKLRGIAGGTEGTLVGGERTDRPRQSHAYHATTAAPTHATARD
jgi:uncharacterized protein (DUF924 family)